MEIIWDIEQNTEEWIASRLGIPTASQFDKIIGKQGTASTQASAYMEKLAGERISGRSDDDGYKSASMQRGHLLEPKARTLFEITHGVKVLQPGIIYPDEARRYSCSPDGIIEGAERGLEIKCRNLGETIHYHATGNIKASDYVQCQGSMLITGWKEWDFWAYCPGLKPFHTVVERDDDYIGLMHERIELFLEKLDELVERVRG